MEPAPSSSFKCVDLDQAFVMRRSVLEIDGIMSEVAKVPVFRIHFGQWLLWIGRK